MIHKTEYRAGYRPFESVRVIRLARFQCSGRDVNESGKLIDRPGYRHHPLVDMRQTPDLLEDSDLSTRPDGAEM